MCMSLGATPSSSAIHTHVPGTFPTGHKDQVHFLLQRCLWSVGTALSRGQIFISILDPVGHPIIFPIAVVLAEAHILWALFNQLSESPHHPGWVGSLTCMPKQSRRRDMGCESSGRAGTFGRAGTSSSPITRSRPSPGRATPGESYVTSRSGSAARGTCCDLSPPCRHLAAPPGG